MSYDLAKLRELAATATKGPMLACGSEVTSLDPAAYARGLDYHRAHSRGEYTPDEEEAQYRKWYRGGALVSESMHDSDARYVAEILNAAPSMLADIERLLRLEAAVLAMCHARGMPVSDYPGDPMGPLVIAIDEAVAARSKAGQ